MTAAAAPPLRSSLASSPDGQWVAIHSGYDIALLAGGAAPAVGRVDIGTADADVAVVGPPSMIVVNVRNVAPRVMLYQPPALEVAARHDLEGSMRIAAITGPRIVLAPPEGKKLVVIRVAAGALAAQTIDLDTPLDFVVGLDRDQLLIGTQRKVEMWDATIGRPLLRVQLQLPPPPRTVGGALGHIWITRPGSDEIVVYRLADGRAFHHDAGAPIVDVVASPTSPIVTIATKRGLIRLHCLAHSLTAIEAPWQPGMPLAQLVAGDDVTLLGLPDAAAQPWRVPIAGSGAPPIPPPTEEPAAPADVAPAAVTTPIAPAVPQPVSPVHDASGRHASGRDSASHRALPNWRERFAAIGAELVRGGTPDLAAPIDDTELAALADRMLLRPRAIRALSALYGLYLVGEPDLSIADLAQLLGDWSEPLGTGELGALAMLRRRRGRVGLRSAVTDLLDGVKPRTVRLVGHGQGKPRPGAWRYAREGKSDAELETLLAGVFGRIAVVEGDPDRALLEAHLRGATAVAFHPPDRKPPRWPRDAALVLVLYGSPSSWIADLPNLA